MIIYQSCNCVYVAIADINSQPKQKDLCSLITPEYAAHWKVIGSLLGISINILDEIKRTFPNSVILSCNTLWSRWLERDADASWKKLIQVIDSPAVATLITSNTAINFNKTVAVVPPQVLSGKYVYHQV